MMYDAINTRYAVYDIVSDDTDLTLVKTFKTDSLASGYVDNSCMLSNDGSVVASLKYNSNKTKVSVELCYLSNDTTKTWDPTGLSVSVSGIRSISDDNNVILLSTYGTWSTSYDINTAPPVVALVNINNVWTSKFNASTVSTMTTGNTGSNLKFGKVGYRDWETDRKSVV